MTSTVIQPTYDNGIKPSTDTTYPWNASTGLIDVNFAGTIGTTNAIQFIKDGYQFAWKPDTVEVLDDQGNLTAVSTVNPNATAQVWKNRLTYVGTTPLTSDEFEVQGNQLKHTVRMVAPPSLPSGYTGNPQFLAIGGDIGTTAQDWNDIDLYADGVSHRSDFTTTDDLHFVRISDGLEIYRIPRITVIDADGNEALGEYKLVFQPNNVVTLYLLVPWNWMQTAVYPVAIDPTVVVSSPYDTSGNGGRKAVRLSNNWIIMCLWNSTASQILFYVSKDEGQTWAELCYVPSASYAGAALASSGTTVYALCNWQGTGGNCQNNFYAFDATTIPTGSPQITSSNAKAISNPDGAQTYYGACSIAIDGTGDLHATWASKNSSFPNYFNLRYAKSTDGGVTWSAPTQISSDTGADHINPCIAIKSNNYPVITWQYYYATGSDYKIHFIAWTGSAWAQGIVVYDGGSYGQEKPCLAIDGNGVLYIVWSGADSLIGASTYRLRYSKSTDGGTTWSAMALIDTSNYGAGNPSLAIDPTSNVLYVFAQGNNASSTSYTQILRYTYNGSTWSAQTQITNSTTNQQQNVQTLWSEFNMNSSDAIRYMWDTGTSVAYDQIPLNSPPNAPTNLSPTGGATVASLMPVLSGTFSDPDPGNTMSALQVKVYRSSDNTIMWDSTKTAMTTTVDNQNWSIQVPSSANLAYNTQYYWTATTWDNSGTQGAWSGNQVFNLSQAPTVTVTSPTANQTVTESSITVKLSYSQANNVAESSYQFQLLDAMGQNVVQDSGTISGKNNMYTFSGLSNNTTYQVVGYATATDGTKGTSSKVSFNTSFTVPYSPTATETVNKDTASVTVNWSNPAYKTSATTPVFTGTGNGTMSQPTTTDGTTVSHSWKIVCTNATASATFSVSVDGTNEGNATVGTAFTYNGTSFTITAGATAFAVNDEFDFNTNAYTVQYNRLYKQVSGSWQLYQDQLSGTSYQDYLVGNGTAITYGVSAMGTNGVESSITSVTATPSFSGDWLHDPTTGKQFQFLYNRAPYDMSTMEERQEFQTFGNKPMIRRGPLNARTGTLDSLMMQIGTSQSPIQQLQEFEANMANHPAYYLKTAAGEVLKVDVHTPKRKMPQEYLNSQAIGITVNWTEVS